MSLTARLVAVGLLLLALSAAAWKVHHSIYKSGYSAAMAEWNAATELANNTAREIDRLNRMSKEKAIDERTKQILANVAVERRNTAIATGLLDSSSRSLQAARSDHAACIVSAITHSELFGECRSALTDMAGKAQGHAGDVKSLMQAWPK
jgi:hypothetical protein